MDKKGNHVIDRTKNTSYLLLLILEGAMNISALYKIKDLGISPFSLTNEQVCFPVVAFYWRDE